MPDKVVSQLKQISLFADLDRDDIRAVAKLVKQKQYRAGDLICRQGEPGHSIYVVQSGDLRVLHVDPQGVEREVSRLGPGKYFGETSLLLGEPRDATVEAVEDATLLYLSKDELDRLLDEQPAMIRDLNMRADVARKHHVRRLRFKWQDEDEFVVVSEHRHDAVLIRSITVPSFVLLVALVGCAYWYVQTRTALPLIVGSISILSLLVFILYLFFDHRDDIYIVTNKRVVRRYHTPLGPESRVDAPLRNIQDIQELQVGLLAQFFDFGDLIIETAGERAHVAFREVPNPAGVREAVFEQRERLAAGVKAQERVAIRDDMRRYFDVQRTERDAPVPASPPERQRTRPTILAWLLSPLRIFTYFLPPLRYEQGDTITWRKHWVALIKPIALPSLLIITATIIAIVLLNLGSLGWISVLIGYGIAIAVLFPWWLWRFDDWQNDIYQVTSTRIIDVERLPLFQREERREASLSMIQNISLKVPGLMGRLLKYGSVTIETAGAGAFTFDHVKDPSSVQAEIFRRMEMFQGRQAHESAERHRAELLDWFTVYDQVRGSTPPAPQPPPSPEET
ncbi:MAG: cyclic nucleotide-binding domain-containing protein [Chloroflexota bacterium]|nr:cyclic nucleotide-binding domain-containing protein [Chloroflexota bacterium]